MTHAKLTVVDTPVDDSPLATVTSLAALQFPGDRKCESMPQDEIFKLVNDKANQYCVMAKLALSGVLGKDKDDLVELIRKNPDDWCDTFHPMLEQAAEDAKLSVQIFTAAAARVFVALATVIETMPPDDDGGEPLPEEGLAEVVAA